MKISDAISSSLRHSLAVNISFVFEVPATVNLIKSSFSFFVPTTSRTLHNHLAVARGTEEHLTNSAEMSTTIIVAQLMV
jgi:hypothetical protein